MPCVTEPQQPHYVEAATGDAHGDKDARFLSALCHTQSVSSAKIKVSGVFGFLGKSSPGNDSCKLITPPNNRLTPFDAVLAVKLRRGVRKLNLVRKLIACEEHGQEPTLGGLWRRTSRFGGALRGRHGRPRHRQEHTASAQGREGCLLDPKHHRGVAVGFCS